MSSSTVDLTEEQQRAGVQGPGYVLNEEEMKAFRECHMESFMYRSMPFSMMSMAFTKLLLSKGVLTASPRFGAFPKMAFAGIFGVIAGKISYVGVCQEKFKKLENSPLGEALRQKSRQPLQHSKDPDSEMSDPNAPTFESMFQPAEPPAGQAATQTRDYGYTHNPDSAVQMRRSDDFSAPAQSSLDEEAPTKKSILYEDLRVKNRENYEVSMNKPLPEKVIEKPKKIVKKNIYGDAWDE